MNVSKCHPSENETVCTGWKWDAVYWTSCIKTPSLTVVFGGIEGYRWLLLAIFANLSIAHSCPTVSLSQDHFKFTWYRLLMLALRNDCNHFTAQMVNCHRRRHTHGLPGHTSDLYVLQRAGYIHARRAWCFELHRAGDVYTHARAMNRFCPINFLPIAESEYWILVWQRTAELFIPIFNFKSKFRLSVVYRILKIHFTLYTLTGQRVPYRLVYYSYKSREVARLFRPLKMTVVAKNKFVMSSVCNNKNTNDSSTWRCMLDNYPYQPERYRDQRQPQYDLESDDWYL